MITPRTILEAIRSLFCDHYWQRRIPDDGTVHPFWTCRKCRRTVESRTPPGDRRITIWTVPVSGHSAAPSGDDHPEDGNPAPTPGPPGPPPTPSADGSPPGGCQTKGTGPGDAPSREPGPLPSFTTAVESPDDSGRPDVSDDVPRPSVSYGYQPTRSDGRAKPPDILTVVHTPREADENGND